MEIMVFPWAVSAVSLGLVALRRGFNEPTAGEKNSGFRDWSMSLIFIGLFFSAWTF